MINIKQWVEKSMLWKKNFAMRNVVVQWSISALLKFVLTTFDLVSADIWTLPQCGHLKLLSFFWWKCPFSKLHFKEFVCFFSTFWENVHQTKKEIMFKMFLSVIVWPGGHAVEHRATTELPQVWSPVKAGILAYLLTMQILWWMGS